MLLLNFLIVLDNIKGFIMTGISQMYGMLFHSSYFALGFHECTRHGFFFKNANTVVKDISFSYFLWNFN